MGQDGQTEFAVLTMCACQAGVGPLWSGKIDLTAFSVRGRCGTGVGGGGVVWRHEEQVP